MLSSLYTSRNEMRFSTPSPPISLNGFLCLCKPKLLASYEAFGQSSHVTYPPFTMVHSPEEKVRSIPESVLRELLDAAEKACELINSYCAVDARDDEVHALERLDAAIANAKAEKPSAFVDLRGF